MVSQFVRFRFKNAAQVAQTFTMFGVSTQSMYFDSYEIRGVEIIEPKAPEVSVTIEGNASSVIKTMGKKLRFSITLDTAQTLEKFDRLSTFVNIDRFTVGITVMQGDSVWGPQFDNYGLIPISYETDCILEFAPLNHHNIVFGRSLQSTTIEFTAHATTFTALPNASDVIAVAPNGQGN